MTSLAQLLPKIASEDYSQAILALSEIGIITDLDLYFRPSNTIPPWNESSTGVSASAISTIRDLIRVHLVAQSDTGYQILQHPLSPYPTSNKGKGKESTSSTGLPSLDALLEGGLEAGDIIEICGPSKSGKTLLVIYTVLLHLILNLNHRAVFIDTGNTFDPSRWNTIAGLIISDLRRKKLLLPNRVEGGEEEEEIGWDIISKEALARLDVTKCITSGRALDAIVASISDSKKAEKMKMVVIDSATTLLNGDLAATIVNNNQIQANLTSFLKRLSSLSRSPTDSFTVILTNSTVVSSPTSAVPPISQFPANPLLKPALGTTFSYLTDLTLFMTPAESIWAVERGKGQVIVEIARNRRGESGGWVAFKSDGTKIQEVKSEKK